MFGGSYNIFFFSFLIWIIVILSQKHTHACGKVEIGTQLVGIPSLELCSSVSRASGITNSVNFPAPHQCYSFFLLRTVLTIHDFMYFQMNFRIFSLILWKKKHWKLGGNHVESVDSFWIPWPFSQYSLFPYIMRGLWSWHLC